MELTTAKNFFLLTERLGKKPALRTRFTSQSYFVLAAFLDLMDHGMIEVAHQTVDLSVATPPVAYLVNLFQQLQQALADDSQLRNVYKVLTSWDVANQLYDGVGVELLQAKKVERVPFQNNLKQHIIFVPKETAQAGTSQKLAQQLTSQQVPQWAFNLLAIFNAMDALQWVFPDDARRQQIRDAAKVATNFQQVNELVTVAADVIIKKRFWLDSWLS